MTKRILYFGIYRTTAPRDKNLVEGLRANGNAVDELVCDERGFRKYFHLWRSHKKVGVYDVMVLGYLSTYLAPLARILCGQKPLIFNAGNPIYDGLVTDRAIYKVGSLKARLVWWADWLAFRLADIVLLESDAQIEYVSRIFGVGKSKLMRVWTGADSSVFFPDPKVVKKERFTVVFRGFFVPATGVEQVLEAIRLLKDQSIDFRLIGRGPLQSKVEAFVYDNDLKNVEIIPHRLEPSELRNLMLEGHVLLGQFGGHERLTRTIQHKTFEALALGMPYVTISTASNRELLTDKKNALFILDSFNPGSIADAIMLLQKDEQLRLALGQEARALYEKECAHGNVAASVLALLSSKK